MMMCTLKSYLEAFGWGFGIGAVLSPAIIMIVGHYSLKGKSNG